MLRQCSFSPELPARMVVTFGITSNAGKSCSGMHVYNTDFQDSALIDTNPYTADDVSNFMLQQYVSGAINFLWKQQKTYILSADSSDCGRDQRGPQDS